MRPNAGLAAMYQKKLDALVDAMQRSIIYWTRAAYNRRPPENLAADEDYTGAPAVVMRRVMKRLATKWQKQFDMASVDLANYFSKAVADRSDRQLASALRKEGISVRFQPTRAMNDVIQAQVGQNVNLIKSIPEQHFTQIEGMVLRSVAAGRDIGNLTKELEKQFGVTKRRAALIAHTQNNLATATMQRTRYIELGINEAIWCHSHAGAKPRPSHVKAGAEKLRYNVDKGALIDDEYILPGQLINCRCFAKPIIPGFE